MNLKGETAKLLEKYTARENIRIDEDMSGHTTFRTGGCSDVYVTPQTVSEAADIVRFLAKENISYTILGNGSNVLVSDSGYRGCIVCMSAIDDISISGSTVTAGAGAILSKAAYRAYERSLTGLEPMSGIPGSVGGAVVMNAGAYGGEMKDVIKEVTMLDTVTSDVVTFPCDRMKFSYRSSIVKEHPYVVLEASLSLATGSREKIKETMDDLAAKRRAKQPLEYPSAGSTFKRPEGNFAGKLIEEAGLRGYGIGGAKVSEKHCGFVINTGGATSADIIELVKDIKSRVFENSGIELEPEIVFLGFERTDIP